MRRRTASIAVARRPLRPRPSADRFGVVARTVRPTSSVSDKCGCCPLDAADDEEEAEGCDDDDDKDDAATDDDESGPASTMRSAAWKSRSRSAAASSLYT